MTPLATAPFLTARWVNLILMSWTVETDLLKPHLPRGVALDMFQGEAYVSLVAFEFLETRLRGCRIPGYVNFPEINLRFYVNVNGQRGVVFLREFVPKRVIAWVARWIYNEPYASAHMASKTDAAAERISVEHIIRHQGGAYRIQAEGRNQPYLPEPASLEHFLKEHDRGYGISRNGTTLAYRVIHPPWMVYPMIAVSSTVDFSRLYGTPWGVLNGRKPSHVMLAQGSDVAVFPPTAL